ncbi:PfkB family carbohydrate kinase [Demequina sp.]|uniref:PfkB family carbohydrate kinase n=1 Tax=Demequina sp. TaxID=2050685 RepID=UPI0025C43C23|nr:PfkB family carbohydrate kinase [Demequina sp.]
MTVKSLFVGLATLDVIQLVNRLPDSNEKVVALDSLTAAGGPAANAAVAAAHLGSEAVLITALADHPVSDIIRSDLAACGVTVWAVPVDTPPVVASILVTAGSGDRAIVSPTSSASSATAASLSAAEIARALDGVAAVHCDGYHPSLALPIASAARERGIPVLFDGGSFTPHTDAVLEHVDIAVVSGDFAPPGVQPDPVSVLAYLVDRGPVFTAVTRGARGIVFRAPHTRGAVPVERVSVADTLGAGDFFHGALAVAIAQAGRSEQEFPHQLAWASRVAGASLGSFGTRRWLDIS